MKRVNSRRAVMDTRDRPPQVESFRVRRSKSGFAVGLSWLTSRQSFDEERQVLLNFVCPGPAADQLLGWLSKEELTVAKKAAKKKAVKKAAKKKGKK